MWFLAITQNNAYLCSTNLKQNGDEKGIIYVAITIGNDEG